MDSKEMERDVSSWFDQQYKHLITMSMHFFHNNPQYRPLAEECVQEVFALAIRHYPQLIQHPNIDGWFAKTCYYRLLNAKRRVKTEREHVLYSLDGADQPEVEDITARIDKWYEQTNDSLLLDAIFERLVGKERIVFTDYFAEGRREKEVAKKNQMTLGAVKSAIRRIRKKAKSLFPSDI